MIAVPSLIQAGESSTLSGQVLVKGRAAAGIVVIFSVLDSTLGAVIPGITITDSKGKFTAIFRSAVTSNQAGFKVAFVSAALPSFPGVFTSSSIGILGARGLKNKTRRRWRSSSK
ncbi:hypothetical protein ACFOLF_37580 [Paenibacillus sepulcri]|uniref:Big-1 domain-containing protein n=1 Tax=Paenibacillus sepulcri TaxID=359917 RepID=A0ABS7BW14_9BACL|nr:hypothetical protein [Paenibacillus sepulcri]